MAQLVDGGSRRQACLLVCWTLIHTGFYCLYTVSTVYIRCFVYIAAAHFSLKGIGGLIQNDHELYTNAS
jgi:hypothetical protein